MAPGERETVYLLNKNPKVGATVCVCDVKDSHSNDYEAGLMTRLYVRSEFVKVARACRLTL